MDGAEFVREARFYERRPDGRVKCRVCPRGCVVAEGGRGDCGVRENCGGVMQTVVYGRVCAAHADPIEKKPFFHFLPGSRAFSLATAGCNAHCEFCQNWEMAQGRPEAVGAVFVAPERIARAAEEADCASVAFTYTEPTVWIEYALDVARAAATAGLRRVLVSNGMIEGEARRALYGAMDAVKIDLKAFREEFYRRVVQGRLGPVLDSLEAARAMGRWVEIVYLLIPGMNDGEEELRAMAGWVRSTLGAEVPVHFSRYGPAYRMREPGPTPVADLERARAVALAEGLRYVYLGNVAGHAAENTDCPQCGRRMIAREGYAVEHDGLTEKGCCAGCGAAIPGVFF